MIYDKLKKNLNNIVDISNRIIISFINGPKVEILGNEDLEYNVQFINNKTNEIIFESRIRNNHWTKCSIE